MLRSSKLLCAVLFFVVSSAAAAETSRYAATAEAKRENGEVVVSIRLTETRAAKAASAGGRADEITTTQEPKVRLKEGRRASIAMAKRPVQVKDARPADDIESGYDVKIVSVKGENKIVMLAA